jgi:hypothetical protein
MRSFMPHRCQIVVIIYCQDELGTSILVNTFLIFVSHSNTHINPYSHIRWQQHHLLDNAPLERYFKRRTNITSQFTRDALIVLAGSKAKGRDFVYFTEVKRIPSTDLATIERLWNKFSGGKFGYSVQKVSFRFLECTC